MARGLYAYQTGTWRYAQDAWIYLPGNPAPGGTSGWYPIKSLYVYALTGPGVYEWKLVDEFWAPPHTQGSLGFVQEARTGGPVKLEVTNYDVGYNSQYSRRYSVLVNGVGPDVYTNGVGANFVYVTCNSGDTLEYRCQYINSSGRGGQFSAWSTTYYVR